MSKVSANEFNILLTYWYGIPSMPETRTENIRKAGFKYLSLHWCDEYEVANGKKLDILKECDKRGLKIKTIPNIDNQITKYYNFYAQFIEPIVELKEVEEVINTEIEFNIKKKILERLNISNYSSLMKKDIEEICEKVFLEELYERTNIKKNKGIKVRSL